MSSVGRVSPLYRARISSLSFECFNKHRFMSLVKNSQVTELTTVVLCYTMLSYDYTLYPCSITYGNTRFEDQIIKDGY